MNVLGIETSCDETAAAVVRDGRRILSNVISSSLSFHKKYGGIIPEIAFRAQLETITSVVDGALKEANLELKDIDLISVTDCPGLLGSLLVGVSFAKSLSFSLGIPLVNVNHLHSHIYAGFLGEDIPGLPVVALIVSGGHTSLFYLKDFNRIILLGSTLDDASGEAFDKVAKILGLGYPGGPVIERVAKSGDSKKVKLSCSGAKGELNFSFSGIKTAVLYYVRSSVLGSRRTPNTEHRIPNTEYRDVAASFQESVIDTLINKSLLACKMKKAKRLIIGGGVAANNRLREKFISECQEAGVRVYFAPKPLCTDNAAMVAGLGYQLFKKGKGLE